MEQYVYTCTVGGWVYIVCVMKSMSLHKLISRYPLPETLTLTLTVLWSAKCQYLPFNNNSPPPPGVEIIFPTAVPDPQYELYLHTANQRPHLSISYFNFLYN